MRRIAVCACVSISENVMHAIHICHTRLNWNFSLCKLDKVIDNEKHTCCDLYFSLTDC